jgi:hypothetical protein
MRMRDGDLWRWQIHGVQANDDADAENSQKYSARC